MKKIRRRHTGGGKRARAAHILPAEFEESPREVALREFLRVVLKYRKVITACFLLSLFISLVYSFSATPLYTAQSRIRISAWEPVLSSARVEDMLQQKSRDNNYLDTQIQEITSFSLADRVLASEKQIKDAVFEKQRPGFFRRILFGEPLSDRVPEAVEKSSGYRNSIVMLREYLGLISVIPVRRTALVTIEATHEDRAVAALVANRHALSYIDWVRDGRVEQQSRGLAFLKSQSDELREKVADIEREMADYAETNSIVAINKDQNITVQKMAQLNQLLTSAGAKKIEAQKIYEEARNASGSDSAGSDDISVQNMRTELGKLEAERDLLSRKFTDNYPRMQQIGAQINRMKESIRTQRSQIIAGLKARADAASESEKNLAEELEQQKSQAFELSKRQVQYNILSRELTSSRELLQNVLRQIKETALAVESNASNISMVDYAVVPREPSFPRKKLTVLSGGILGLLFGLGLAYLIHYLDNTFRHQEDVQGVLKLPALGMVPSFAEFGGGLRPELPAPEDPGSSGQAVLPAGQDSGGVAVRQAAAFLSSPASLTAEAYRTIRTAIMLSQAGEPPRTILMTSAHSSEGKTTSVVNLAMSLASAGGRVCLIDADLRRPAISRYFACPPGAPGLTELLTNQRPAAEVIVKEAAPNIDWVPAGKIPPNPSELLGSLQMAALIDELSALYDYVLIDSPPVLPVTDSVVLSRCVEAVVLVVRAGSTPKKLVVEARQRLRRAGAKILGVVLNDVSADSPDYYYYSRYYQPYISEGGAAREERKTSAA